MGREDDTVTPRPRERELPVLGEWRWDEETVGLGFFPEEVGLRWVRPDADTD